MPRNTPQQQRPFGKIKRLPSGNYRADYPDPRKNGKRIAAPATFSRKEDAQVWLSGEKQSIDRGTWKSPEQVERERAEAERKARYDNMTFGDYYPMFRKSVRWAPSSARTREPRIKKYILPYWEDVPIKQIDKYMIDQWVTEVVAPLGYGQRKEVWRLFKQIMRAAEDSDVIDVVPKVSRHSKDLIRPQVNEPPAHSNRALSREEVQNVIAEASDESRPALVLMVVTGMRPGEVRGLKPKAIDFKNNLVRIEHTVKMEGEAQRGEDNAKTRSSLRTIPIDPRITAMLKQHISSHMTGVDAYVFQSPKEKGRAVSLTSFQKTVKATQKRHDYERMAPYCLRHTFETQAQLTNGAIMMDVDAMMGHEVRNDPNMQRRYSHASLERQRLVATYMADWVLNPPASKAETRTDIVG
ncbi:MAG: tyrosine-type recombinase/integrase [Actinomyces sp.]|nr:tyrosine-type recombinase/integrase [Actinomyces sp.]